ncbi:MAG: acyloxyacyl hydrolase [Verrucomicrobiae bacterium]
MKPIILVAFFSFCAGAMAVAGAGPQAATAVDGDARRQWALSLESAQMFNIDNNPNRYFFLTQMLSFDYEPFRALEIGPVRIRTQVRSTIFASAIFNGPESFYLGWGPQLRFLFPIGRTPWTFFAGGGAGLGYADADESNKDDYGLGQKFTFIMLASGGIRYDLTSRWSVWSGLMWHHLSNADMSEPKKKNIGPDELGIVTGAAFAF